MGNDSNFKQHVAYVIGVYRVIKQDSIDMPDTKIVANEFPKYGIFISYRTWMNISAMRIFDLPEIPNLFYLPTSFAEWVTVNYEIKVLNNRAIYIDTRGKEYNIHQLFKKFKNVT